MAWYAYIDGNPLVDTSYRILPLSYTLESPPGCSTGCRICAIFLNQTTTTPVGIDPNILDLIPIALTSGTPQRLPGPPPFNPYRVLLRC